MRSRSAASPRCSATTPTRAWRSRSRCASSTCRTSSRRRRWRRRSAIPEELREDDFQGRKDLRELHFVTIDGETARDFDDAVYCTRAKGKGLAPVGGDRRRQPLRAPRRRARPGRARARHLGVLPAPRDPDAAGEALQRPVLAQPERRAPRHGVRDGDHAAGRGRRATSSTRRCSARARASPTPRSGRSSPPARRRPSCRRSTICSTRCTASARAAARSTSTPSRRAWCSTARARSRRSCPSRATTRTASSRNACWRRTSARAISSPAASSRCSIACTTCRPRTR